MAYWMTEERVVEEYVRAVGHPPRKTDHPDWLYRGTKEELKELRERFGLSEENEEIEGQESLL